jgi:hypothetical protein
MLRQILQDIANKKEITRNANDPTKLLLTHPGEKPIFVDPSEKILVTGQLYAGAARFAMELSEQLVRKGHVVHLKTSYVLAKALWRSMHWYGFLTQETAARHFKHRSHSKKSPYFEFHMATDGQTTSHIRDMDTEYETKEGEIHENSDVDIIVYLKDKFLEADLLVARSDMPLDEKLIILRKRSGLRVTKILVPDLNPPETPDPSDLDDAFGHIIVSHRESENALKYTNRIHLRDTRKASELYLGELEKPFLYYGSLLHAKALGHGVIVTRHQSTVLERLYKPSYRHSFHYK